MKNCGTCYYRDSTWSPQHREMSARCDHEKAPDNALLELRVGADSVVDAPYWCPMSEKDPKFELHPFLKDASLERACELADSLVAYTKTAPPFPWMPDGKLPNSVAFDLSYMLEYLRLNFDLVEKK